MLLTTLAYTGNIVIMAVELRDGQREKGGLKRQGRYQGLCIAVKKKGGLTIKEDLFCFMVLDSSVLGGSALGTWVRHGYGRDWQKCFFMAGRKQGEGMPESRWLSLSPTFMSGLPCSWNGASHI